MAVTPPPGEEPEPVQSQDHQSETAENRGFKRSPSTASSLDPEQKRQRTSACQAGSSKDAPASTDPVAFWVREGRWPKEVPELTLPLRHLVARKRGPGSNSTTSEKPHAQPARENKAEQFRDDRYEALLESKSIFMEPPGQDITDIDKNMCSTLLHAQQPLPRGSIFDDDTFKMAFKNLRNRNEARVTQDISRLIVPSAETLALDHKRLSALIESVKEEWDSSIPLTDTHPQPDYAVGFRQEAFEEDQLAKLAPFTGNYMTRDQSFFLGTYYMYFPFVAYEMKHGHQFAERKNAETMTVAIRGVVELFRAVEREKEIDRRILGFSISHDQSYIKIHGHYPVIDGKDTEYCTHPIHKFDITAMRGRERWTSFRFTKNVYETWAPLHLKRICSAINQLPAHPAYNAPSLSAASGLLSLGPGYLLASDNSTGSAPEEELSPSSHTGR